MIAALHALSDAPPLTPDGDEARRWAEQELSNPVYAAAKPTFFDRVAQAVGDFFSHIFDIRPLGATGSVIAVIAAVVIVGLIIAAFFIWGRPRSAARTRHAASDLFGDIEERSAAELRRAADEAAARGAWEQAIALRFRGLARGLDERGVVSTSPGATAQRFARAAGRRIPSAAALLASSARAFDDVRYLRRPGTPEMYRSVLDAETATAPATRDAAEEVPA